jgi:RNA-dependent RNA polymerase
MFSSGSTPSGRDCQRYAFSRSAAHLVLTMSLIGDYDGDVAEVYWDPELVGSFKNTPEIPHPSIDHNFTSNTEKVSEFLTRTSSLGLDAKIIAMHDVLMDALQDSSPVGIYSGIHDHAIFTLGYADPRTMLLGRM